jgi:hypothetical protein
LVKIPPSTLAQPFSQISHLPGFQALEFTTVLYSGPM